MSQAAASQPPSTVAIIGAGVAGGAAAQRLHRAGWRVSLFDKGRGVGGRASTRCVDDDRFDHGAQYFTTRDPAMRAAVRQWQQAGAARRWRGRIASISAEGVTPASPEERWIGVPGMNAVVQHLCEGIDVRLERSALAVRRQDAGWQISFGDEPDAGPFDRLIVTSPPPQAAALIRTAAPALAERLGEVCMLPCWALMASFDLAVECPFDAAFVNDHDVLRWVARDSSKFGRPAGEQWVAHANHDWSQAHLKAPADEVTPLLTSALRQVLGPNLPQPSVALAHRWRYAFADNPVGEAYLEQAGLGLIVCGDWCLGPRVEGAYLSGLAAAAALDEGVEAHFSNRGAGR